MQREIIWFTTYMPNVEKLNRFFAERKINISAYYSPIEEIYNSIHRLIEEAGLKVAIIRGGFAPEIKNNISIPVVNVNQTAIDFYNLFPQIESLSKKAALVGWYSEVRGLDYFLKQAKVEIRYVDLHDCGFTNYIDYATQILLELKSEGVDLVVSGGAIMKVAAKYGLKTLYVGLLDDRTILSTATEAQYQLRLLKEQESRFEFINSIFNCISEGVIAVNAQWEITNINPVAVRMLGIQTSRWNGEPLGNYLDLENIQGRLMEGRKVENQIISLADKRLVISAVPSVVHGKTMGVVITLQQIDVIHNIEKKLRSVSVEKGLLAKKGLDDIVGHDPGLLALKRKAMRYAVTDSTVLIPGESGLFELANTGTIFLDEISETSLSVQTRLLRVLQERSVIRIGGSSIIPLDVRIIAATNRNLREYIRENKFRQDLYYRLCVLPLQVMPLRERRDDILELVYSMLHAKHNHRIKFTRDAEKLLVEYDWPGNVRELVNFVERILVLHDKDEITMREVEEVLFIYGEDEIPTHRDVPEETIDRAESERDTIQRALQDNNWNRGKAAAQLGISTTTLWRKMKRLNL